MMPFLFLISFILCIANNNFPTTTQLNTHEPIAALVVLNLPLSSVTDDFTQNIFKQIDKTFGNSNTTLDAQFIKHLKNTYLYLIFLTKLELVQTNNQYQAYKTDFAKYLTDNGQPIPTMPDATLLASDGWKSIQINATDVINSTMWQLYCQISVCDIYTYYATVLQIIHDVEDQTFNYIPNFETSFYDADYTSLRNINEMARIRLILENLLKQRWLAQCNQWKNLPTIASTKNKKEATLESTLVNFRKTNFYVTVRKILQTLAPTADPASTPIPQKLVSPLKEQVWCYYMLYEVFCQLTNLLTEENLQAILQACESSNLIPQIIPYTPDDYAILNEVLLLKSKAGNNHTSSIHPSPDSYTIDSLVQIAPSGSPKNTHSGKKIDSNKQVKAQSIFDDLAHDVSSAFNDVKNAVESIASSVENFGIAIGQGLAGVGAEAVGFFASMAGDEAISQWGSQEMAQESATYQTAINDMNTGFNDFAAALKDGVVAPIAELTGDLAGLIFQDQQLGTDIDSMLNQASGAILNVITVAESTMYTSMIEESQLALQVADLGAKVADVMGTAVWAIYSKQGQQEFLAQGDQLGQNICTSLSQTFTFVYNVTKTAIITAMQALGAIVNALTTFFYDIVREAATLYAIIAAGVTGQSVAQTVAQTREDVTSNLEAYRDTTNQIMGVVACVVADVAVDAASAGAASEADIAIDEAIMTGIEDASSQAARQAAKEAAENVKDIQGEVDAAGKAASDAKTAAENAKTGADANPTDEAAQAAAKQAEEAATKAQENLDNLNEALDAAKADAKTAAENAAKKTGPSSFKRFFQRIALKFKSNIEEKINSIKSLGKSATNLFKSNADALKEADELASNMDTAAADAKQALEDADENVKNLAKKYNEDPTPENKEELENAVKDRSTKASEYKSSKIKAKNARATANKAAQKVDPKEFAEKMDQQASESETAVKNTQNKINDLNKQLKEAKTPEEKADLRKQIESENKALKADTTKAKEDRTTADKAAEKADPKGYAKKMEQEASESKAQAKTAQKNVTDLKAKLNDAPPEEKPEIQKDLDQANKDLKDAQAKAKADEAKAQDASKWGKIKAGLKAGAGGGAKLAGMAMNIGMNLGSIISGFNQDQKNLIQTQAQQEALEALWSFVNASKLSMAQQQFAFIQELQIKMQAYIGNQVLGLALSQNITNEQIEQLRQELAQSLAPMYAQLLTVDPSSKLLPADIGSIWNLQSNYIDLYPSQGFFTTSSGRLDFPFAQEIAQTPEIVKLLIQNPGPSMQGPDAFWFNQRCTARDNYTDQKTPKNPTDPLLVQISLQFIYTLNTPFHVGLYLGGNYHDYTAPNYVNQFVTKDQNHPYSAQLVDIDEAHLAKMIVLYRNNPTDPISLGIYEHEGTGWILQQQLPTTAQLDEQHTYSIQTMLNGTTLSVVVYVDDNTQTPIINKNFPVTALENQRTYGMICSGAAITWNQTKPTPTISTTAQTPLKQKSIIDINKQTKVQLASYMNPAFGAFKLTPFSKPAIMQQQYIYATTNTDLKKILNQQNDQPIDFVIFANNATGAPVYGLDPVSAMASSNPVIISLINGAMYNSQGNVVGNVANIWSQYQQHSGPFNSKLTYYITKQQTLISTALTHIQFGAFILDIIAKDNTGQPITTAIANGQYIYTCTQTLKDAQGKPLLDNLNKPILDYMVCADNSTTQLTIGMPPTAANATALFSLITGNVYTKTTAVTTTTAPKPTSTVSQTDLISEMITYISKSGLSTSDPIYLTISSAQQAYATAPSKSAASTNKSTINNFTPVHQVTPGQINNGNSVHIGSGTKTSVTINDQGTSDVGVQQASAAGGADSYQLPNPPSGVHI